MLVIGAPRRGGHRFVDMQKPLTLNGSNRITLENSKGVGQTTRQIPGDFVAQ